LNLLLPSCFQGKQTTAKQTVSAAESISANPEDPEDRRQQQGQLKLLPAKIQGILEKANNSKVNCVYCRFNARAS